MQIKNFLPLQYDRDAELTINHNYLKEQFSDLEEIWSKVREVVLKGDYTLGSDVDKLEEEFAFFSGAKYAIGVGSGTDALFLSLKSLGISEGDEVITTPFTFYATIGAIVTSGAKPVFADIQDNYNIDPIEIEKKITNKTKAIMPVHWSGNPCDINKINQISKKYNIPIVYDACHAINAEYNGKKSGGFGTLSCFSFHPLKNLNVWGDGGIITTNSAEFSNQLKLLRNHGLNGRDTCQIFGYNSRLDTIQAVIARHLLKNKIEHITNSRINNSTFFDRELSQIKEICIPKRDSSIKQVFHLYQFTCVNRDRLKKHLNSKGIDAKIHYPTPMHLQPAAKLLNYKKGDFPKTEYVSNNILSLPVHEFITKEQRQFIVNAIHEFYN